MSPTEESCHVSRSPTSHANTHEVSKSGHAFTYHRLPLTLAPQCSISLVYYWMYFYFKVLHITHVATFLAYIHIPEFFLHTLHSSGTDAGDHPPITPMRSASRDQIRDGDWRLYDFITRHFLASVSWLYTPTWCQYQLYACTTKTQWNP